MDMNIKKSFSYIILIISSFISIVIVFGIVIFNNLSINYFTDTQSILIQSIRSNFNLLIYMSILISSPLFFTNRTKQHFLFSFLIPVISGLVIIALTFWFIPFSDITSPEVNNKHLPENTIIRDEYKSIITINTTNNETPHIIMIENQEENTILISDINDTDILSYSINREIIQTVINRVSLFIKSISDNNHIYIILKLLCIYLFIFSLCYFLSVIRLPIIRVILSYFSLILLLYLFPFLLLPVK